MWCFTNKADLLEKCLQSQKSRKVKKLLSRGANPDGYSSTCNCSFLSLAITQRNAPLVKMMLQAGASTNQTTWNINLTGKMAYLHEFPLQIAAMQGHLGIVKVSDSCCEKQKNQACRSIALFQNAHNRDARTRSSLTSFTFRFQLLLEYGANINIGQDTRMGTALHQAARHGHNDIASLLLNQGADIIAIDRSLNTPLHTAAEYGYINVAQVLLQQGAPANVRNCCLSTPLHNAAMAGTVAMTSLLLKNGADPSLTNIADKCARDMTENKEIRDVFLNHKAQQKKRETKITSDFSIHTRAAKDVDAAQVVILTGEQTRSIKYNNNLETCDAFSSSWKKVTLQDQHKNSSAEPKELNYWEIRRHKSLHQQKRKRKSFHSQDKISRTLSDTTHCIVNLTK